MARTLQRIQDDIYFSILQTELSPILTSTSKTAIWRLWVYIFSYAIWIHELICEKNALNTRSQNLPNTIEWILDFHDGLPLVWKGGQFVYDLTDIIDAEERKIIAQCSVLESQDGILVIKVARKVGNLLEPLLEDQLSRLKAYAKDKKVPGVEIQFINKEADLLNVKIRVYVDPQMIDINTGKQLNVTGDIYPVNDAIDYYLTHLEFNGAFVINYFTRVIEDKDGINLVDVEIMQHKYDDADFSDFKIFKVPESGHYKLLPENLEIIYEPYVLVNN